jgi:hypothetical protein
LQALVNRGTFFSKQNHIQKKAWGLAEWLKQ